MEFKKIPFIILGISLLIIGISFLFKGNVFIFLIGLGLFIGISPFAFFLIHEANMNNEKEEMFLEFSRNLVESVKAGTPVSKSIVNLKGKKYGILTEHIDKLANQILLGIPLNKALHVFSKDIRNKTISRALTLIGQAERAGGDIGEILESVAGSVSLTDKLKKERKAAVSTLVVQGYIIFLVFIIIILVMQFKIIPLVSGIGQDLGSSGVIGGVSGRDLDPKSIANAFLYLLLIQGFFSGLTIGKLSSGSIKSGTKHSLALMLMAFLISASANLILGGV
jgi:flagellar protein FlaJ|tara:strand:- start:1726 stop:2565 length:840 start_codon:yes stop_codon:yes gene_type:complete